MKAVIVQRYAARGLCLTGLLVAGLGVCACGSDGITPACPEAPAYDVRDQAKRESQEVIDKRAQSVAQGCATPLGSAKQNQPPGVQAGAPSK